MFYIGGRLVCFIGTLEALLGSIELSSGVRCITIFGIFLASQPECSSCDPPSKTWKNCIRFWSTNLETCVKNIQVLQNKVADWLNRIG